jgi:hypothetical protein
VGTTAALEMRGMPGKGSTVEEEEEAAAAAAANEKSDVEVSSSAAAGSAAEETAAPLLGKSSSDSRLVCVAAHAARAGTLGSDCTTGAVDTR